jgi:hypothetical protein
LDAPTPLQRNQKAFKDEKKAAALSKDKKAAAVSKSTRCT